MIYQIHTAAVRSHWSVTVTVDRFETIQKLLQTCHSTEKLTNVQTNPKIMSKYWNTKLENQ